MMDDGYQLHGTEAKGEGVFATRPFHLGETVMRGVIDHLQRDLAAKGRPDERGRLYVECVEQLDHVVGIREAGRQQRSSPKPRESGVSTRCAPVSASTWGHIWRSHTPECNSKIGGPLPRSS